MGRTPPIRARSISPPARSSRSIFADGQVDVDFNMMREVAEETGLDLAGAARATRSSTRCRATPARSSSAAIRLPMPAEDDRRSRIRDFVAAEAEPEIEGPVIIRIADRPARRHHAAHGGAGAWHFRAGDSGAP